jgi:hypothetical protein
MPARVSHEIGSDKTISSHHAKFLTDIIPTNRRTVTSPDAFTHGWAYWPTYKYIGARQVISFVCCAYFRMVIIIMLL